MKDEAGTIYLAVHTFSFSTDAAGNLWFCTFDENGNKRSFGLLLKEALMRGVRIVAKDGSFVSYPASFPANA